MNPAVGHVLPAAPRSWTDCRAGYREAVWSEWTKYRSVRSTKLVTAVLGLVVPVFAVIVAATESLQPDDTVVGASLLGGAALAQVLAAALGSTSITSEFKTGSIRTTLSACPRRLVVLAAKASVAAAVVLSVTLTSAALSVALGVAMLDNERYATGDPIAAVVGVSLATACLAVIGVGIGTIVRHSAGAVAAVIGVVVLPGLLAPLLGDLRRWLGGASIEGVVQKLTQSSEATPDAVGSLGAWPSFVVVIGYTVATILGAAWVLRRRDT